jgi:hypothetical protein
MADTPAAPADVSVTPFYLDKGLWVSVLTPVLLWLNQKFGLALDAATIIGMVLPVVAYVIGHKWKSSNIAVAQVQAASAAAAPAAELNK